ncbi:chaperonin 10-like protein [Microdochium trichocladiopsis]|uniref:Chaperonin 10-like protein n=1 Tax=Microdochium trichocladiopsis TaxID=1682393 RepID=A0A9P8XRI1_9PEZI|nr:chaperonin 10-like protein [Microdochium trichocladiopsis]KAH7010627.1 chaperonin 10-like protein [Microdochium trichocladiopsis]
MSHQRAIQIKAAGKAELVTDAPLPELRDDHILVKTAAVALNPTDWKHIDFLASPGAIVGCDYSGTVQAVGAAVRNGFKPGDRVMGMIHGSNHSNHQDGGFAEYVTAKGDTQMRIPVGMSFEAAATLGAGIITLGQALYQSLGLPLPDEPAKAAFPVLIYGGSTATGSLAIQFAKLSGLEVVTTCSPRHNDFVRGVGADHVFDYNSPQCAADIQKATDNQLQFAFDTVATEDTAKICVDAFGTGGGKYTSLSPIPKLQRDDVVNLNTMAFTAVGEAFHIGDLSVPAVPEEYAFAVKFVRLAQELLTQGRIKAHPFEVRDGGLEGALSGLQEMREGKISGKKLVYKLN